MDKNFTEFQGGSELAICPAISLEISWRSLGGGGVLRCQFLVGPFNFAPIIFGAGIKRNAIQSIFR
jgi:hypothetical protein